MNLRCSLLRRVSRLIALLSSAYLKRAGHGVDRSGGGRVDGGEGGVGERDGYEKRAREGGIGKERHIRDANKKHATYKRGCDR
jgi:hypothetical protein